MTARPVGAVRPDQITLLAFLGIVLFGGLNAIGVSQTVKELAPFWGAAMRFVVAGLIMAAIVVLLHRSFPRGRSLTGAILYGLVAFAASYGFAYLGLRETPPGTAAVLIAIVPLLTFALAIAQGQERFRLQGLIGGVIAVAGVAIVFADRVSANVPAASLVLLLLGTVCIAESGVIAKWIPRSDPFGTNAVAMLTGSAVLLALSLVAGEPQALPSSLPTWAAVGYLVVFGSVVMFALYLFTLERWTASAVSYMTLLLPLVTIPLSALLFGERITPLLLIGGTIVLVGVYVGAFLTVRPARSTASSLPECVPVADCPPAAPERSPSASG